MVMVVENTSSQSEPDEFWSIIMNSKWNEEKVNGSNHHHSIVAKQNGKIIEKEFKQLPLSAGRSNKIKL